MAKKVNDELDELDSDIGDESELVDEQEESDVGDGEGLLDDDIGDLYGDEMMPMDKHKELLQTLTNFDPYIREKFFAWSGLKWDDTKKMLVRDSMRVPVLNAEGANSFCSHLQTYCRGNNIITVLDENTYNYIMQDVILFTVSKIADCYDSYDIKNNSDQIRILNEMVNSTQLVLCGTAGGKYNDLLSKITHRQEHVTLGEGGDNKYVNKVNKPKQGFISKLKNLVGGE